MTTTTTTTTTTTATTAATNQKGSSNGTTTKAPVMLPKQGMARVKSVVSGDTVVLLGKTAGPNQPPPEVTFTLEGLSAPRLLGKTNPTDEPGAFPAREWLRRLVIGKQVRFETRKQGGGGAPSDRVYGWLFVSESPDSSGPAMMNLALECVRQGHATPKAIKFPSTNAAANKDNKEESKKTENGDEAVGAAAASVEDYESQLLKAYHEAKEAHRGIHATATVPLVRSVKNAVDDFAVLALVDACQKLGHQRRVVCVVEHVFDGSRFRCQVTDPDLPAFQYAAFTLLLAGVSCPRLGNPKADPPVPAERFADQARQFVETRLLQRELPISLLGTDKAGACAVGTVHHPAGNIAVELLKNGLGKMTDWTVRMMPAAEVPALRVAENNAKRTLVGVWHSYAAPVLSTASQVRGTVVEVISGDTVVVLPVGKAYDSENVLVKLSLASVRAPRPGNERAGRPDDPYSAECKERLRVLTVGKEVAVQIHYERDIPLQPGVNEKRPFGTFSVGKCEDIAELLISEGLAVTQTHRDDDEKSPRYDELRAAEATAKAAKKGMHKDGEYKKNAINDLTDQRKAKTYAGSLTRAGTVKAMVDFVFNGALFKLYVPAENCHIRFAPDFIRCPQPSPTPGSKQPGKPGEPFGDESKRHARLHVLQRNVEIVCTGVTNSGIITGSMFVGQGAQRRDYTIELLGAGLATVDQRKIDFGEAPKNLIDAQETARQSRVGLWSVERQVVDSQVKTVGKSKEVVKAIRLSEIRSGSHFFFQVIGDEAVKVVEESMKLFTQNHGTAGAPCDPKVGKVVAALFNDGTGEGWYRAKIIEKKGNSKVSVLFVDHGNVEALPVASHLRPLDPTLGVDRIPPVATEAVLALTVTRPLDSDEGLDAARMLQLWCWGKDLQATTLAPDESGKLAVVLTVEGSDESINARLIAEGIARVAKQSTVDLLASRMVDKNTVVQLAADLAAAQGTARKSRVGMWRYGDVGDEDPDEL